MNFSWMIFYLYFLFVMCIILSMKMMRIGQKNSRSVVSSLWWMVVIILVYHMEVSNIHILRMYAVLIYLPPPVFTFYDLLMIDYTCKLDYQSCIEDSIVRWSIIRCLSCSLVRLFTFSHSFSQVQYMPWSLRKKLPKIVMLNTCTCRCFEN